MGPLRDQKGLPRTVGPLSLSPTQGQRCRAKLAHARDSTPDSDIVCQVKVLSEFLRARIPSTSPNPFNLIVSPGERVGGGSLASAEGGHQAGGRDCGDGLFARHPHRPGTCRPLLFLATFF